MSVSALEKLQFVVGMTDMVSAPLKGINKNLTGIKNNANAGFDSIRGGAIGLGASFLGVKTLMQPVYDMQEAVGEVRSLNVAEGELKKLQDEALNFSVAYGESAAEFVRSSYDIQSAIAGLRNGELAKFTEASNVLAKGTKADAGTITNYMGTMYGIFSDQAEAMGKAKWVEQLTGQTAAAVQMFKTTWQEMSSAFTSVGANATAAGIGLSEQMAILGTLQSTMSGSEAGTKYKAFLAGVANAQDKLGMSFTDSQGRMLPMLDILNKLKGRFGDTLEVAESKQLKEAFGSEEAVGLINLLMKQTDGLSASITKLGRIKGMDNARDMAKAMVDPWEQFRAVTEGLRIAFGTTLLPTINDVLSSMTSGLTVVMAWTREFPHLTKWVGLLALGIILLGGAVGLMSVIFGIGRAALAGFGMLLLPFRAVVMAAMWAVKGYSLQHIIMATLFKLGSVAVFAFSKAMMVLNFILKAVRAAMIFITSPVGILIAAIAYGIYKLGEYFGWWDKLKNLLNSTKWGQALMAFLDKVFEKLGQAWEWAKELFGFNEIELSATQNFKVNKPDMPDMSSWKDDIPQIETLGMNKAQVSGPTARESVTQMLKGSDGSKSNYFGGVTFNVDQMPTPEQLEAYSLLGAG
jgi:TP901 family phage tail tape measure protein